MMVILPRIIGERRPAEFSAGPCHIEGMFQKMFFRDVLIDPVEIFVHTSSGDSVSRRLSRFERISIAPLIFFYWRLAGVPDGRASNSQAILTLSGTLSTHTFARCV